MYLSNWISELQGLDYKFWIPIFLSIGAFIWGYINSRNLEKLKTKNEKQIYVHKERFNKEFEVYKRLWVKVFEFETIITSTYNQIKTVTENQTEQEYNNHNTIGSGNYIQAIQDSSNAILQVVEMEKPFYDMGVYEQFEKLKSFMGIYFLTDTKKWESKGLREFLNEESIPKAETKQIVEAISESIRKRIGSIESV